MSEFDEGWKRLVGAARSAQDLPEGLSAQRVRELARLARRPRVAPTHERRSLVALAATLACVFFALVPVQAQVGTFLGALPSRVPRPPQPPPAALALELLPDLSSFCSFTFTESQP